MNRGGGRGLRLPPFDGDSPSRRHAAKRGARVLWTLQWTIAAAAEAEIPATKARELPVLEVFEQLPMPCRETKRRATKAAAALTDFTIVRRGAGWKKSGKNETEQATRTPKRRSCFKQALASKASKAKLANPPASAAANPTIRNHLSHLILPFRLQ